MNESQPQPAETNLVGHQLGDYHVLRRLGRGGMAEVYLAQQESLDRKVAVKVLRPDFASDENYVRRFQNEARAVASLVHANIVQIYEVGCIDGFHFLAQEYVPGQTLKQLVNRNGGLDVRRAVSILRQISAALDRAGKQNMVHRDIKPENILLTPNGEAKVADFGLARLVSADRTDMTQVGMTMGTPLYMSPEQVEGKPVDRRSDIYSCGVTAFFMLAGQPPFEGDSALNIAVQHLQKAPPLLEEFRNDLPPKLCEIVAKMLEKSPDQRYDSGGEILRELRELNIQGLHDEPFADELIESNIEAHQLDATMQLQSLMATQAMATQRRRNVWLPPALIAGALMVGGFAARANWSGPILAVDSTNNDLQVKPYTTVKAQFLHAKITESSRLASNDNKQAAFQAVWENFPDDYYYELQAKRHLGMFYLNSDQSEKAAGVFSELVALDEVEVEARTFGLAGQVLLLQLGNDPAKKSEIGEKLAQLWPNRGVLEETIRQAVEAAADELKIRSILDEGTSNAARARDS